MGLADARRNAEVQKVNVCKVPMVNRLRLSGLSHQISSFLFLFSLFVCLSLQSQVKGEPLCPGWKPPSPATLGRPVNVTYDRPASLRPLTSTSLLRLAWKVPDVAFWVPGRRSNWFYLTKQTMNSEG